MLSVCMPPKRILLPGEIPTVLVARQRCEFVGPRDIQPLFGIPADFARSLFLRGLIRAVLLKRPGSMTGALRLYDAADIRKYIRKHYEQPRRRREPSIDQLIPEEAAHENS